MALFHMVIAFQAIVITKGGTVNGPVNSVDCIWFNALMSAAYFIFWLLIKKFAAKKLRNKSV